VFDANQPTLRTSQTAKDLTAGSNIWLLHRRSKFHVMENRSNALAKAYSGANIPNASSAQRVTEASVGEAGQASNLMVTDPVANASSAPGEASVGKAGQVSNSMDTDPVANASSAQRVTEASVGKAGQASESMEIDLVAGASSVPGEASAGTGKTKKNRYQPKLMRMDIVAFVGKYLLGQGLAKVGRIGNGHVGVYHVQDSDFIFRFLTGSATVAELDIIAIDIGAY
jgi:hypothetical protein